VAGPSANRFGHVSPTRARHVADEFGDLLTVLDGGDCAVGIESAIVDCTREQPALLRPGQLSRALIEQALGRPLAQSDHASPRSPGALASHYAPRATLHLFDASTGATPWSSAPRRPGSKVGVYSRVAPLAAQVDLVYRQQPAQSAALAHDLFAALREFDATGVSEIWVQRPPPDVEWDGVRDRLQRASWPQP
jgi:L-threonylcarbamoyladenylate synthase